MNSLTDLPRTMGICSAWFFKFKLNRLEFIAQLVSSQKNAGIAIFLYLKTGIGWGPN